MASSFHGKQTTAEGIHIPYQWSYANSGARTGASGFVAADVGKLSRQTDDNSLWLLSAVTPTWVQVNVTNGDSHDHSGGDGAQIAHTALSSIGTNTHAQIDTHVANTSNPHSVTAAQAGALSVSLADFANHTELTIATGAVTVTQSFHSIDGETDLADDLATINGGSEGTFLIFRPENAARNITLKNGTGNILTGTGADMTIDDNGAVILVNDGTNWRVIGGGGGGGGHTQNTDTGTTNATFTVDSDAVLGKIIISAVAGAADRTLTIQNAALTDNRVLTAPDTTGTIALTSQLVTNGDSHDHSGGDGAQVDHGGLGGLGDDDHTQYTKKATLTEQGDVYYASAASTPSALAHGWAGQKLMSGGHGANPSWSDDCWVTLLAGTDYSDTPPSTSTVTMSVDHTSRIKVGMALRYTTSSNVRYGVVTAITANLLTVAGPPLVAAAGNLTVLAYDPIRRPEILMGLVSGNYADAADTDLMLNDMYSYVYWAGPPAYVVHYALRAYAGETGVTKDKVQVHVGGNDICTTAAGITVDDDAVYQTVVDIDPTNYLLTRNTSIISLASDGAGTNKDAVNLSYWITIVYQ